MALQAWFPLNKDTSNKGLIPSTSVNNGATLVTDGKFGKSYSFGGSQYIDTGFVEEFGTGDFTISVWMYLTQTAGKTYQCIVGNKAQAAASVGCAIYWNQNQKKFLWSTADGSAYSEIWTTNTFDSIIYNSWHHIVMVRNNSDAKKGYFYIDGERKEIASVPAIRNVSTSTTMKIGAMPANSAYFFTGKINDVRIYNHAISDQDAKDLYWGKVLEFTPQWKHSGGLSVLGDASGFNYPLTPYDVTLSNNIAQFNGTSSYIGFNSPNISGGSVSIWFSTPTKPNSGYKFLYYDPVSKMLVAFSSDGTLHVAGDGSTQPRYQTTGITWGQLTNVVATWDSNRKPTALYVNGVKPATGSTTTWSTAGTACAIGRRLGVGNGDYFSGSINEVKVFASQLTAADAQYIYHIGPNQNKWTPDEPVWLRVLHHNNPGGARFASQEDGKNKDTEDQFSKLKIFFNNDNFRRANGSYEFMAKEKLESGSTEQVFRWTQTSNPTASTVTGYKLISQTIDAGRNFGLKNNGSYAVFHNGNTWWCACGSWSAFNNGIPGFGGTVLTGYLDLYVRVDKVTLPAGYTELQYVQSDGTAYINAIVNGFNTADWEIYCKWMVTGWGVSYGYIFGAYSSENETSYRVILQNTDNDGYYASSNCRAGSSIGVTNKAKNVIHTATLRDKSFDFDGVTYSAPTTGTAISTASTLCIFGRGSGTQNSKARVYELYGKKGGIPAFNLKPAKRDSDNAIGFYDLVNNRFVTKTGNGTLTGE